jgi:hypothetical protein
MLGDQATKRASGPTGRGLEGAAQGAASDAAPQPPAPNTNLVLSVPEHLSVTLVGLGGLAHPKPWPTNRCGFGEISPPAERIKMGRPA